MNAWEHITGGPSWFPHRWQPGPLIPENVMGATSTASVLLVCRCGALMRLPIPAISSGLFQVVGGDR